MFPADEVAFGDVGLLSDGFEGSSLENLSIKQAIPAG